MCYREGKAGCVNIVTCGFIYIMTGLYKGTSLLAFGEGRTVLFSCLLLGFLKYCLIQPGLPSNSLCSPD